MFSFSSPESSSLASFVRAVFELQVLFSENNNGIFIKVHCYYGNLFCLEDSDNLLGICVMAELQHLLVKSGSFAPSKYSE